MTTTLFQPTLIVPISSLKDHYTGKSMTQSPLLRTLERFDREEDIVIPSAQEIEAIVLENDRALSASHQRYNAHNFAAALRDTLHRERTQPLSFSVKEELAQHGEIKERSAALEQSIEAIVQALQSRGIVSTVPEAEQIQTLYQSIRQQGIKNNPSAIIQNDGSIVLEDGHKRAAIALKLGYERLTVDILGRMPQWKEIVENLARVYGKKGRFNTKLYQPINHPEFNDWEVARGNERIAMIESHFSTLKGKRVLDLGACLGHFSRWAERKGAQVDAIEGFNTFYQTAKLLNTIESTDVTYHKSDVVEWVDKNPLQYDLTICLSIIHNIAQQGRPQDALRVLRLLSERSPQMLFDIGEEGEKGDQVSQLGLGLSKSNLPAFIRRNTAYTNIQKIGTEKEYCNRDLYLLSR